MKEITWICLGVRSMNKSIKFYIGNLGFKTDERSNNPDIIFFDTPGTKFELYPLDLLAEDINKENPTILSNGFSGITLAYDVQEK